MFLTAEFVTLCLFFCVFAFMRRGHLEEFQTAQKLLDPRYALVNSLVLITSGYAVARAIAALRSALPKKAATWIALAILLGLAFVAIKGTEYAHKFELGLTLSSGHFWFFYYFLTGFHFLHVLLGIGFLSWVASRLAFEPDRPGLTTQAESCAAFWHMLDLVWIVLFPLLYLL
jgi:nitric oxide reductase NorE protein